MIFENIKLNLKKFKKNRKIKKINKKNINLTSTKI